MTAESRGARGFLHSRGTPKIRKGHVLADMPDRRGVALARYFDVSVDCLIGLA